MTARRGAAPDLDRENPADHAGCTITSVVVPGNRYTLYTEHFEDLVGAFNQVYRD